MHCLFSATSPTLPNAILHDHCYYPNACLLWKSIACWECGAHPNVAIYKPGGALSREVLSSIPLSQNLLFGTVWCKAFMATKNCQQLWQPFAS